jgi:hypothetical protein
MPSLSIEFLRQQVTREHRDFSGAKTLVAEGVSMHPK